MAPQIHPGKIKVLTMLTNFHIGGTERQVTNIALGLDSARFDLHLACLRNSGELLAEVEALGAPRPVFPIGSLYGLRTFIEAIRLIRYIRRNAIQVVHSYGLYPNIFTIPAARLARAEVVVASIRDRGDIYSPFQRWLQKLVCRLADCVLVNAEAIRETLIAEGYRPDNIVVIRNGYARPRMAEAQSIRGIREELGWPADAPVVMLVSRLNRMKGIEYFLDAASMVAAKMPETRFLLVGDGSIKPELKDHAACLGLSGRVAFTGFRTDVATLLAQVDLSVLPSLSEGLSNTLLESMAAGVPVIATRVGGNPEAVEDGVSGLLVPARDSAALADAIGRLLQNRALALKMAQAGKKRIAETFSMERSIREVERLYEQLVSTSGPCLMEVAAQ
jgi:glycosyltransferase involved in cell wall biosynthesis